MCLKHLIGPADYKIDYIVNHHPPCQYKLGRQQLTYADYVEMGEDGYPPTPLARASEKCCLAVANPQARKGYFEVCVSANHKVCIHISNTWLRKRRGKWRSHGHWGSKKNERVDSMVTEKGAKSGLKIDLA